MLFWTEVPISGHLSLFWTCSLNPTFKYHEYKLTLHFWFTAIYLYTNHCTCKLLLLAPLNFNHDINKYSFYMYSCASISLLCTKSTHPIRILNFSPYLVGESRRFLGLSGDRKFQKNQETFIKWKKIFITIHNSKGKSMNVTQSNCQSSESNPTITVVLYCRYTQNISCIVFAGVQLSFELPLF